MAKAGTEIKRLMSFEGAKIAVLVAAGITIYYGFIKQYIDRWIGPAPSA